MNSLLILLPALTFFSMNAQASEITERFDHDFHRTKVFEPHKIQCNHCHMFSLEDQNKKIQLDQNFKDTALRMPVKQICHECHQSPESQYTSAPKDCYTCHRSVESLNKIKPLNHKSLTWRDSHSTIAKVQGDKCFECHTQSKCTKCHLERNDIQFNNHSRNFRFYHSVQARLQPQKCSVCHSVNFCISCHRGKPVR